MNFANVVKGALRHTSRVTMELSNQCQLSRLHARCPAHRQTEPSILPRKIITNVLATLAVAGFNDPKHTIAWHGYNEPMIDPRLFSLMAEVRHLLPHTGIRICTNGEYLTRDLFLELIEAGATRIVISAYSREKHEELTEIVRQPHDCSVRLYHVRKLDDRDSAWVGAGDLTGEPCRGPLYDLMIWSTGILGLCCYDTRHQVEFANLNFVNFGDALPAAFDDMDAVRRALEARDRSGHEVCQHCRSKR